MRSSNNLPIQWLCLRPEDKQRGSFLIIWLFPCCVAKICAQISTNVTCVVVDILDEEEDIKDVIKVDVGKVVGMVVLSRDVLVTAVVLVGVVESFIGRNDVVAVVEGNDVVETGVVAASVVVVVESFIGRDDIIAVVEEEGVVEMVVVIVVVFDDVVLEDVNE